MTTYLIIHIFLSDDIDNDKDEDACNNIIHIYYSDSCSKIQNTPQSIVGRLWILDGANVHVVVVSGVSLV